MLVEFKVSNFASFDELQNFSMLAGKVRNHNERIYVKDRIKLLKFMAVYGANASGKSNLVSAFEFAKSFILGGSLNEYQNMYCKLEEENKNEKSHFEFTILLDNKRYTYGFEIVLSSQSLQKEWLYELTYGKNYKVIFDRNIVTGEHTVNSYFKNNAINERLSIYADDIKNDDTILFLHIMNLNKDTLYESSPILSIYRQVYDWFKYDLSVNFSDSPVTNYSHLLDSEGIDDISKLLATFGTGITKFDLVEISMDKVTANVPKEVIKKVFESLNEQKKQFDIEGIEGQPAIMLRNSRDDSMFIIKQVDNEFIALTFQFCHENTNALFSLNEESDGTIRLLDLIEILLSTDNGTVYIIDEINRRFHPQLTEKFVKEYLKLAEKRNIQLIVTTHESKIMDLNLLRKDEIGFVDKDEYGKSSFFSLDTFGERFDKRVCQAYFNGDYGAIPRFKNN